MERDEYAKQSARRNLDDMVIPYKNSMTNRKPESVASGPSQIKNNMAFSLSIRYLDISDATAGNISERCW
jgi:hypothetical protein